jgi:hypothetical protein
MSATLQYCYIKIFSICSESICNEVTVLLLARDVMDKKNLVPYATGSCRIPLEAVYTEGSIPPTAYNVVKGEHYCGEIKVGLSFTREVDSKMLPPISIFY